MHCRRGSPALNDKRKQKGVTGTMKITTNRLIALVMTFAMVMTIGGFSGLTAKSASAAKAKALKLSKKTLTLQVGTSGKVTLKNAPKGAKVKWSSKNKKIATVSKKGKITAKKAGKTKVTAKVTYRKNGKKVTKSLKVTVKVQKAKAVKPTNTQAPSGPTTTVKPGNAATPTAAATVEPTKEPAKPTKEPIVLPTVNPFGETSNLTDEHLSENGITTKDNGQMRDMNSDEYMRAMGMGWNYGNSLEQAIDTSKMTDEEKESVDVNYCETSANNVALTQKNVDGLKAYGFNNVRIPVAWSNLMDISEDGMTYTINPEYMDRVEEVMNYCLNNEMYVIINIHYDGDWWGQFGDKDQSIRDMAWARYRQIWTQLSERYKEYSDRLIFESANEELGDRLNDDWRNRSTANKTGVLTVDEQYETINQINQEFVNIVRESGGNNEKRYLLIAGYSTNIDMTCDDRFKMPTDTEENGVSKLSVSVHYYNPWNYCGGSEYHQGEGDAPRRFSWGTDADLEDMRLQLDKMKKFTEQGYGVIIGEYGVQTTAADGVPEYLKEIARYSLAYGMIPVLWDNGAWYNREKNYINYGNVADAILEVTGASGEGLKRSKEDTSMPLYRDKTDEEANLTPLYTWEGEWKKNGGGGDSYIKPSISSVSEDGKWTFHCNTYGYWSVIYSEDMKNMTQPYLRITCKDGDMDNSALELSGADFKEKYPASIGLFDPNEQWETNSDFALEKSSQSGKKSEIPAEDGWSGKIYAVDPNIVKDHEIIWISCSNKPIITKIEVFDGPEVDWKN